MATINRTNKTKFESSKTTATSRSRIVSRILYGKVSLTDKALFAKHMSVMLKSGLTITETLETAVDTSKGRLQKILKEVAQSVQSGKTLSTALGGYEDVFSELFINVIYAGESSGTLVENLEHLAVQIEKEKDLRSKILGAMIYPIIVFSATFVLSLVLAFVVLPKMTPLFTGLKVDLPLSTRLLIVMSDVVQEHFLAIFFGTFTTIFTIGFTIRRKFMRPVTHWILLHTPFVKNVVRDANLVLFSRTLRMLLKSGLNIDETLDITHKALTNYYYKAALGDITRAVRTGSNLSKNLLRFDDLFPVIVSKMVRVGEESGQLEETLQYLEEFYEKEVDVSTRSLSIAIEPLMLLFLGLGVGFLALAIITPIYSITGSIQN